MARPVKNGLDYFPFDVHFFSDPCISAVTVGFGIDGAIIAVHLLCAIYQNGYFIEWNKVTHIMLRKELPGVTADMVDKVIGTLVEWGFFDKTLFDSDHVLTSLSIQQHYFRAKRWKPVTSMRYLLVTDEKV